MSERGLTLPAGVGLLARGEARYFTQRQPGRPMVDCMFAALCTPLSYMGLDVQQDLVARLRTASGVPLHDKEGKPQGTTTAASQRAVRTLFGELPGLLFGRLSDDDLLQGVANGEFVVRVMSNTRHLPPRLKRWVGRSWNGGHAIAIGGARKADGAWEVFWMDPAGRPKRGYAGEWVLWTDVSRSLKRTTGHVIVTAGERDAVIASSPIEPPVTPPPNEPTRTASTATETPQEEGHVQVLTGAILGEFARVRDGTPFLHPTTLKRVTRADGEGDFRLAGRTTDGKYTGVWVKTRRVPNASGLTLLVVETALIGTPFVREPNQ